MALQDKTREELIEEVKLLQKRLVDLELSDSELKKTEKTLQSSEERFRKIFEQGKEAMFVADPQTRMILDCNLEAEKLLSRSKKELLSMHIDDIHPKEVLDETLALFQRLYSGENLKPESLVLTKHGQRIPVSISSACIEIGGKMTIVGLFRNIAESKEVEDALRKSEEWLRSVMFSMVDWVWEVDAKGVYTYSSHEGFDLLGLANKEIIGKKPFDFMPPEEAKRVAAIFSEIAAKKAPIKDLENWNIRKDGQRICLCTNGVPILDKEGNLLGYRGVDKDITERKKSEEQLRDYAARLTYLTKYANDFIILLDKDFCFLEVNDRVSDFYGYTHEELIGMQANNLRAPDAQDSFARQIKPLQTDGKVVYETVHQRKDGTRFPVEISLRVINTEGKRLYQAIIRDITERRKLEEETRKRIQELEVFYKTSISREERIIELKKEVESLKKRLGK
jgi:two-component system, cell cycle sensor histidine kinase and response regulator CckA